MSRPPHRRRAPEVIERWTTAAGAELLLRPVHPDDAGRELRFLQSLSPQTRYERAFAHRGLLPGELRRLVRFDVRREIALLVASADAEQRIVAVARLKKSRHGHGCEFALVVGDGWQRQGIGARLLRRLLAVAQAAGIETVTGHTLATNAPMKALGRALGFTLQPDPDDATVTLLSIRLR